MPEIKTETPILFRVRVDEDLLSVYAYDDKGQTTTKDVGIMELRDEVSNDVLEDCLLEVFNRSSYGDYDIDLSEESITYEASIDGLRIQYNITEMTRKAEEGEKPDIEKTEEVIVKHLCMEGGKITFHGKTILLVDPSHKEREIREYLNRVLRKEISTKDLF